MREYVATAKTVEEAIQLGCEALSVDRDDLGVSYEILEMPQKTGFLGLKVTPAKVKVTVETADTEPETTPAAQMGTLNMQNGSFSFFACGKVNSSTPIRWKMGVR